MHSCCHYHNNTEGKAQLNIDVNALAHTNRFNDHLVFFKKLSSKQNTCTLSALVHSSLCKVQGLQTQAAGWLSVWMMPCGTERCLDERLGTAGTRPSSALPKGSLVSKAENSKL